MNSSLTDDIVLFTNIYTGIAKVVLIQQILILFVLQIMQNIILQSGAQMQV